MNDKVYRIGGKSYKKLTVIERPAEPGTSNVYYSENHDEVPYIFSRFNPGGDYEPRHISFVSHDISPGDTIVFYDSYKKPYFRIAEDGVKYNDSYRVEVTTYRNTNIIMLNLRPSDDFLKKYCKLVGIDRVLVEVEKLHNQWQIKKAPDLTVTVKAILSEERKLEFAIKALRKICSPRTYRSHEGSAGLTEAISIAKKTLNDIDFDVDSLL